MSDDKRGGGIKITLNEIVDDDLFENAVLK